MYAIICMVKFMKEKFKKIINNPYFKNIFLFLLIFGSFIVLDVGFRYRYNSKLPLIWWDILSSNLFTIFYALIFSVVIYALPRKVGKIVYAITYGIIIIFVCSQSIHFETLGRFWRFNDLFSASEGATYFLDVIKNIDKKAALFLVFCFAILLFTVYIFKKTPKISISSKNKIVLSFSIVLLLGIIRCQAIVNLGEKATNHWVAITSVNNVYYNYMNPNLALYTSGIYEYMLRSTYFDIKDRFIKDYQKDYEYLDNYFDNRNLKISDNSHTGILKDKNVIFVMLESIDSWLVNEEVMPNLTKLEKTGINFTNRFAPTFGSGYTFNSEYALNTGYYSPTAGGAFNFTQNDYSLSFANLLKNNGYKVNSVHANDGDFYNRIVMHKALGYENHYALDDVTDYSIQVLHDDRNLVKIDEIYNLIVNKKEKFMSFITTISAHFPYNDKSFLCANEKNKNNGLEIENNPELSCIRTLANMTDQFIGLLLDRLEEDNLLDNTALVFITDHYMYSYSDKENLYKLKGTNKENLLQKTPFVVWSKDIKSETNDSAFGTVDIMPTILNMLDIDYNPNYYLGNDVYGINYPGYVYFSDNSWYDGTNYFSINSINLTDEQKNIATDIGMKIEANNKLVQSDYFAYKFK